MDLDILKNKIKGPAYPIITPFKDEGFVDYLAVSDYVDFLCSRGAKIIYTMAHSSRLGLMNTGEVIGLNDVVCSRTKQYDGVISIAATPMYRDTKTCMYVAEKAENAGADLISVIFNERYYYDEQIIEFFKAIANSVSCGILIHEEQLNTIYGTKKMNWPFDLLERIVEIDNVIAIKEDAKDDGYTHEIITRFKDKVAIIVSGGSKKQFLNFADLGCQSYLVGVASFDPKIAVDFYDYYLKGEIGKCQDIINNIEDPFFNVSKTIGWHIGIKSAMEHLGVMSKKERRPLMEVNNKDHAKVAEVLKRLGYL